MKSDGDDSNEFKSKIKVMGVDDDGKFKTMSVSAEWLQSGKNSQYDQ